MMAEDMPVAATLAGAPGAVGVFGVTEALLDQQASHTLALIGELEGDR